MQGLVLKYHENETLHMEIKQRYLQSHRKLFSLNVPNDQGNCSNLENPSANESFYSSNIMKTTQSKLFLKIS